MIGAFVRVPDPEGRPESFFGSNFCEALYVPAQVFLLCSMDWSEYRDLRTLSDGIGLAATAVAGTPGRLEEDMSKDNEQKDRKRESGR